MAVIHHSAVCVRDLETSLRFWRDGLGFDVLMDEQFEGDWPTLLHAPSTSLRSVFLGDPAAPASGIVELVDLGPVPAPKGREEMTATSGFLLLSVMTDVEAVLARLAASGLGGAPRRVAVSGIAMAVVTDPDGVLVELIDTAAARNLDHGVGGGGA
jgi:catechol 2,3-dioxygenase-like lactoylglutathione lyase family enzyme